MKLSRLNQPMSKKKFARIFGWVALTCIASIEAHADTWEWRVPLPVGNDLLSVTATGTGYVAVGREGVIVRSATGAIGPPTTWTQVTSPISVALMTPKDLRGVAANGATVVAVGEGGTAMDAVGTILRSTNSGVSWSKVTSFTPAPPVRNFSSVTFAKTAGGNFFVAVGESSTIYTSPDGSAWTKRTAPPGITLQSVSSNGVAVAAVGQLGKIIVSTDGITWTAPTVDPDVDSPWNSTRDLNSIAGKNTGVASTSEFLVVGENDTLLRYGVTPPSVTPRWVGYFMDVTLLADPQPTNFAASLKAVAIQGGRYIVMGETVSGFAQLLTSTNPATGVGSWTGSASSVNQAVEAIAGNGTNFVAVGESGTIATSVDGGVAPAMNPWQYTSPGTQRLRSVAFHGVNGVAVGEGGEVLVSHNSGDTWGLVALPGEHAGYDLTAVTYVSSSNKFVAVAGNTNGTIFTSTDGSSWAEFLPYPVQAPHLSGIAFDSIDNVLVAIGHRGSFGGGIAQVSLDGGATWTITNSIAGLTSSAVTLNAIAWDSTDKVFVAVGENSSSNSIAVTGQVTGTTITWTMRGSPMGSNQPNAIAWDAVDNLFIVGGEGGMVVRNPGASVTWSAPDTLPIGAAGNNINGLTWYNNTFVAVGEGATVVTLTKPTTTTTWTRQATGAQDNVNPDVFNGAVLAGGATYVVGGLNAGSNAISKIMRAPDRIFANGFE